MDLSNWVLALLALSPKTKGLAKALRWLQASMDEDEKLRALAPGEQAVLELPDALDPKFRSRGGKRFSIDAVVVQRLGEER